MNLFSNKFVKKEAVKNNIVVLFLYNIAYPLSKLFAKLNIKPNIITIFSILFSILSFIALIMDNGYIYFIIFWGIAAHLDFCDGTVARLTGRVNKTAFRFDHMSDVFKISLVFLGAGIRYETSCIWILSCSAIFSYLYSTILGHDYSSYINISSSLVETKSSFSLHEKKEEHFIRKWAKNSIFLRNIYTIFATINGHTLLLIFPLAFGPLLTKAVLFYFICLTSFDAAISIKRLRTLPKF